MGGGDISGAFTLSFLPPPPSLSHLFFLSSPSAPHSVCRQIAYSSTRTFLYLNLVSIASPDWRHCRVSKGRDEKRRSTVVDSVNQSIAVKLCVYGWVSMVGGERDGIE